MAGTMFILIYQKQKILRGCISSCTGHSSAWIARRATFAGAKNKRWLVRKSKSYFIG